MKVVFLPIKGIVNFEITIIIINPGPSTCRNGEHYLACGSLSVLNISSDQFRYIEIHISHGGVNQTRCINFSFPEPLGDVCCFIPRSLGGKDEF